MTRGPVFNAPTPYQLPPAGNIQGGAMGAMSVGLMRGQPQAPRAFDDYARAYPGPDAGLFSMRGQYGQNWTMPGLGGTGFNPGSAQYNADMRLQEATGYMQTDGYGQDPMQEDPQGEERVIDLSGPDLAAFLDQLVLQFKRAGEGRQSLVAEANKDEQAYNQTPYLKTELPFEGALSLRIPAARSRVDKAASELGATFDRDGSPVFGATSLTDSMAGVAPHVESFIHQNLVEADAINQYRIGILRSFKVGTSFLSAEVISRPVSGIKAKGFEDQFNKTEDEYENALVIRSVKMQDMYVLPTGISDIKEAGFVGERFQMPRWRFNDMQASGFYQQPMDENMQPLEVYNGTKDDDYGLRAEHSRLRIDYGASSDKDPAGIVDLVKGWIKFQSPSLVDQSGDRRSKLYYCVFPANNPRAILRLKENPYTLLDYAPYVPMPAGMGDGTIWGESWMRLLRSLQHELDTLHMLHIEAQKRAYSRFYLTKEDSGIAMTLKARAQSTQMPQGALNPPATIKRIMPDEIFETEDPTGDIKDFAFADSNPGFMYDEQKIIAYMNAATIDDMPTSGSVKSAFEMRQAATQTASKLKAYLKTVSAMALKPHIEIVKAILWQYKMPVSAISDYVKFLEYGDVSKPITMTDFFSGVSLDPAGTTTSADETVAITTTASLTQEIIPLLLNVPGIVQDVPGAIREIVKERVKALGYQRWSTLFGLTPPSEQDIKKNMMYMMLLKQLSAGANGVPQDNPAGDMMGGMGAMGGDGGMVQGAPGMNVQQAMTNTQDSQGGSANGVAPQMAQMMGAPQGQNA